MPAALRLGHVDAVHVQFVERQLAGRARESAQHRDGECCRERTGVDHQDTLPDGFHGHSLHFPG
jgi:hypothetical protein